MRSFVLALLLTGALVAPGQAVAGAADLTETRRAQLSPRLLELGFTTPALAAETNVRVLLPDGYGHGEDAAARAHPRPHRGRDEADRTFLEIDQSARAAYDHRIETTVRERLRAGDSTEREV